MADNFGLKIGVEGEKAFKDALKDINATFKVLASEMNLVNAQFDKQDKSIGAAAARADALKSWAAYSKASGPGSRRRALEPRGSQHHDPAQKGQLVRDPDAAPLAARRRGLRTGSGGHPRKRRRDGHHTGQHHRSSPEQGALRRRDGNGAASGHDEIFNQYESWFASFTAQETADFLAWFETIKDILDENTAGHLLNLIEMRSRPATVIVSADNSSANSKGAADFVCPTTGAETVINQTIASLGSLGGKVLLLEGTYSISAPINLASKVTLEGMGSSDTVITRPASSSFNSLINAANVNNVTIRGLLLNAANTQCTCAYFEGCSDALVYECVADGTTVNGFHFYKSSRSMVVRSRATQCLSGIVVEGEAGLGSDALVSDNFCFSNTRNGVLCKMPNRIVTGNDCRSNGGPGILHNQCSDASVCGNVSLGNTPEGIVVDGSKIEVSGNVCNNNSSAGIRAAGSDMNIASNICKSNAIYGIRVMSGSAAMTISANTCNDNQTTGIECYGTAICLSGNSCRNNKIFSFASKAVFQYSLQVALAYKQGNSGR